MRHQPARGAAMRHGDVSRVSVAYQSRIRSEHIL